MRQQVLPVGRLQQRAELPALSGSGGCGSPGKPFPLMATAWGKAGYGQLGGPPTWVLLMPCGRGASRRMTCPDGDPVRPAKVGDPQESPTLRPGPCLQLRGWPSVVPSKLNRECGLSEGRAPGEGGQQGPPTCLKKPLHPHSRIHGKD